MITNLSSRVSLRVDQRLLHRVFETSEKSNSRSGQSPIIATASFGIPVVEDLVCLASSMVEHLPTVSTLRAEMNQIEIVLLHLGVNLGAFKIFNQVAALFEDEVDNVILC